MNDEGVATTWIERKIWAIPNMAIGVIRTVYHLALFGLSYVLSDATKNINQYKFCAIRDLEEIYGNFVLIFHDKLGLYHIQQAQFQKQCYFAYFSGQAYVLPQVPRQNCVSQEHDSLIPEFENKYNFRVLYPGKYSKKMQNSAVQKITLLDYKSLPEVERQTVVKRISNDGFSNCPLDKVFEELLSKGLGLAHLLEASSDTTLEMFTLEDLIYFDLSPLKFVFMTDKQVMKSTINELGTFKIEGLTEVENFEIQCLRERLTTIELPDAYLEETLPDLNTLNRLTRLTAEEICEQQQDLNPLAFAFLSNEQIALLELSQLTMEQSLAMFAFLDTEEVEIRLSLFKDEDVICAINENKLTGKALGQLPESYFFTIDFSSLDKTSIARIFFDRSKSCDEGFELDKERFANFDVKDVVEAIKLNKLDSYHLSLLSKEQLIEVKPSELQAEVLKLMFFSKSKGSVGIPLDRERFANFDAKEVAQAIKMNKLTRYHLRLLSVAQLQAINFSEISQIWINILFPDFSVDALRNANSSGSTSFRNDNGKIVTSIICHIGKAQLQQMSEEQKQKNEDLFDKLLPEQQEVITPRLYKASEEVHEKPCL